MRVPLSWLKDYVEIEISPEELAEKLTFAGLEVEEISYLGVPAPKSQVSKVNAGLVWDRDKFFVGQVLQVKPHPNADRLTLAVVDIGKGEPIQVVTGAPNLKIGDRGVKVAFVLEGARLYDGHKLGQEVMTLKRSKIRGIESGCMVCSEKELGLSDEHEGIIILPDDAPVGTPLADYLGDIVFDVKINPNMARCASIVGIAREVGALTGKPLRYPSFDVVAAGEPIEGQVQIVIQEPALNPRFTLALIKGVTIKPSPFWMQRRLTLAGMRPINNIVDVTNYVMLELGQPSHAFDYDKVRVRADGTCPTIITRLPTPGERLTTLDGVTHTLPEFTILVCDTRGALSIGGVMGGAETEIDDHSKNILLEAAAWEMFNIRRTMGALHISSEAGLRFSRGVHPSQAMLGLKRGIELMRQLSGGVVAQGFVDVYPLPPRPPVIEFEEREVNRLLGLNFTAPQMKDILTRLEFQVETLAPTRLRVTAPDHRMDVDGVDDLAEEVARIYGHQKFPSTVLADVLPPQRGNPDLEREEAARDILVNLGLQEIITYALTTREKEKLLVETSGELVGAAGELVGTAGELVETDVLGVATREYVVIENPISPERVVMRQTLLAGMLENLAANLRYRERAALFEIGPVFLTRRAGETFPDDLPGDEVLPLEPRHLAMVLTGPRALPTWQAADTAPLDFYDLKGCVEGLLDGLHLSGAQFIAHAHPALHPGRACVLQLDGKTVGILGELHPLVCERFDLPNQAVLVGEFDLDGLLASMPEFYPVRALSRYPVVVQDLARVVDETLCADRVEELIRQTGGELLTTPYRFNTGLLIRVQLFDVYRGDQIPRGKKSLAYTLTFQAMDRTLTDADASKLREKIAARLKRELGAEVRGG